ncbi:MAG: hypothetical protein RL220_2008 [Bacteroidota bacterium]
MISYLLRKLFSGILVLLGVVTFVFILFSLAPGDPARDIAGENATEEVVANIRRRLDLDISPVHRYFLFLNDVSPLSIHHQSDQDARNYFDDKIYSGVRCLPIGGDNALYIKWPYFGRSYFTDKGVGDILGEAIPGTLILAVMSIALALIFGVFLGTLAALRRDSFYDRLILVTSALGMSGPSFFMAILVGWIAAVLWHDEINVPFMLILAAVAVTAMFLFSRGRRASSSAAIAFSIVMLAWIGGLITESLLSINLPLLHLSFQLPGTGLNLTGSLYAFDPWKGRQLEMSNMILPIITLTIRPLAVIVQLTRSSMLDVLAQDYIRTAKAKGLTPFRIIWKHALRNALNPVITAVSGWFASLLAGAVFVEFVFGWKGLGQEMYNAIERQDLPVVMGGVMFTAFAFVLINVLVDVLYGVIDPRIRSANQPL